MAAMPGVPRPPPQQVGAKQTQSHPLQGVTGRHGLGPRPPSSAGVHRVLLPHSPQVASVSNRVKATAVGSHLASLPRPGHPHRIL